MFAGVEAIWLISKPPRFFLVDDQKPTTDDSLPKQKPAAARDGLVVRREKAGLVVARTCRRALLLRLQVLFEELHKAVDQPAPAPNHMETALVLVFLENMIQFVFEIAHWNIPRFGLTAGPLPQKVQVFSPHLGANPRLISLH